MSSNPSPPVPLTVLNRLRRSIEDVHAIAAAAAAASKGNNARLEKAAVAFASLRSEVASLALDLAELQREIAYAQRDALADRVRSSAALQAAAGVDDPWDAETESEVAA